MKKIAQKADNSVPQGINWTALVFVDNKVEQKNKKNIDTNQKHNKVMWIWKPRLTCSWFGSKLVHFFRQPQTTKSSWINIQEEEPSNRVEITWAKPPSMQSSAMQQSYDLNKIHWLELHQIM